MLICDFLNPSHTDSRSRNPIPRCKHACPPCYVLSNEAFPLFPHSPGPLSSQPGFRIPRRCVCDPHPGPRAISVPCPRLGAHGHLPGLPPAGAAVRVAVIIRWDLEERACTRVASRARNRRLPAASATKSSALLTGLGGIRGMGTPRGGEGRPLPLPQTERTYWRKAG